MFPTLLGLVLFFLPSALMLQQTEAKPPDKCSIEGLVVAAGTGAPLKKAWLTLRKTEQRGGQPYTVMTDPAGRFVLKDIEPGKYRLWVQRNGFVAQEYGQRAPNRPGTMLTLQAGQQVKDIVLRLIPAAVIAGHVYDEDGEPAAGVMVQALRYRYLEGQRRLFPAGMAYTNDQGEYRMYGFAPDRYYLSAVLRPGMFAYGAALPAELGDTGQARGAEGFAPVYYPGTNDLSRAVPIELSAGSEVVAVDLTLVTTRTVRLRGRVFNAVTGSFDRNTMVWLMPRDSSVRSFGMIPARVEDPQGVFELPGVTPGSYFLIANWYDEGKSYTAREPIDVGASDIEGINLTIAPGVELRGRIQAEGDAQLEFTELRVSLRSRDELPMGGAGASVKSDGTFVVQNVGDGVFRVSTTGAPEDFFLKAARAGSDDVLEPGLTVSRGQASGSLELVLSSAGGRVEGVVVNEQQQPFSGARVVLVPDSSRRSRAELYKTTTTDQNGMFSFRGAAPGEYKLFAWEEVETGAYQDPDFLRSYEDRGQPLSVQEGGRYTAQLKVIPADQTRR